MTGRSVAAIDRGAVAAKLSRTVAGALALVAVAAGSMLAPASAAGQDAGDLRTHAEATDWEELTPHEEVVEFYRSLTAASPYVRMDEIGRSIEDRPIHRVVLSRSAVSEPWEAHATGKPVLFIGAQVHGDEPAGKEGLMIFARELALGEHQDLLDDVVFVFIPQINPDGAESGDWGRRNNAAGHNINRDYMALRFPETRAVVGGVLTTWRPHVLVDSHELVGPPRIYDFYTRYGQSVNGPWAPRRMAEEVVGPAIVDALDDAGYSHFYYHRLPGDLEDNPQQGLSPGAYGARALSHYGGPHGAISILYEARRPRDAREEIEDRTRRQVVAMEALGQVVAERADEVVAAVEEGREEVRTAGAAVSPDDSIAVDVSEAPAWEEPYEFLRDGDTLQVVTPVLDSIHPEQKRIRPVAYAIDGDRDDVVEHLRMHGIHVERLRAPADVELQTLQVADPDEEEFTTESNNHRLPARTYIVRTAQPGAPLAMHFLEPEDINSLWGMGWFEDKEAGDALPIHRLLELPDAPMEGSRR